MSTRAGARVRWGVLISLGLCGAAVAFGWSRSRATSRTVTLANGVVLRAVAVTYGTNHVVRPGGALGGVFGEWIGFFKPSLARPRSFNYSTPTPRLAIFLQESAASAARRLTPVAMSVRLEDEHGVTAGEHRWVGLQMDGAKGIHQVEFAVIPHRSRVLRLTFQAMEDAKGPGGELGSLTFANPAFRSRPQPLAGGLPAAAADGDLEVTLSNPVFGMSSATHTELGARGRRMLKCEPAPPGSEPYALGVFQFRAAGSNTTAWVVGNVQVPTAVGDRSVTASISRYRSGPLQVVTFGPVPWPDESWPIEVWATPHPPAAISTNELVVLETIAVPPPGQTNTLLRVERFDWGSAPRRSPARRGGLARWDHRVVVLVQEFIHGAPPHRERAGCTDPSRLILEIPDLPEGCCVELIRAVDEQGRALEPGTTAITRSSPTRLECGFLQVPEGAKTLEFTLALQRARVLRLTARPGFAGTNGFVLAGDK